MAANSRQLMCKLFTICLLCAVCNAQAQRVSSVTPGVTSQRYSVTQGAFERYAPGYEVGRTLLPGLFGFLGGAMRMDTQRGRAVQTCILFGGAVSIGAWKDRTPKKVLIRAGAFVVGAALGFAINQTAR